jgi:hypothetical protein
MLSGIFGRLIPVAFADHILISTLGEFGEADDCGTTW